MNPSTFVDWRKAYRNVLSNASLSRIRQFRGLHCARANDQSSTLTEAAKNLPAYHVLVIEDEPDIREMLAFTLTREGFRVTEAETAEQGLERLAERLPDIVLIDWMLPGQSGVELARRVRRDAATAELPLIMLTARGEEADKLRSFESGIDDYVTKPFSPKELIARIRALLRRSGAPADGLLTLGPLVLDTTSHTLTINAASEHLGPTEFRLLEVFLRHPNRVFDRSQLLDRVWGRSAYVEERTVDVHVLRLRKVLRRHQADELIQTVRGVGYRLTPLWTAT